MMCSCALDLQSAMMDGCVQVAIPGMSSAQALAAYKASDAKCSASGRMNMG